MTLQGRTYSGLVAGAIGGFAAWLLIDKSGAFDRLLYSTSGLAPGSHLYWLQAALGGVFGLIVSVAIALVNWTATPKKSSDVRVQTVVLSGVAGLAGGAAGIQIGQWAYTLLLGPSSGAAVGPTEPQLIAGMIARCVGWAAVGLAVGAAQGIPRGSWRASRLGGIGGLMGGIAGGGIFEALEIATSNPPLARLLGLVIIGSATGFFLEFVPYVMKQAWVKLENGRGAGGEFLLDKDVTTIGRSDLADIRLADDPSIAPVQCTIERNRGSFWLRPAAQPLDTEAAPDHDAGGESWEMALRPDQPDVPPNAPDLMAAGNQPAPQKRAALEVDGKAVVAERALFDGQSIRIGDRLLRFHVKTDKAIPDAAAQSPPPKQNPILGAATSVPRPPRPPERVPAAEEAAEADARLTPAEVGYVATSRRAAGNGLSGTQLVCVQGPYYGQTFALASRDRLVIGRASECDIAIKSDKTVSRRHIAIYLDYGRHEIEDLRSANRTYVNDGRLLPAQRMILTPGDIIRIGDTVLKYE